MIKRFVAMFIATAIMCRHSQPQLFSSKQFDDMEKLKEAREDDLRSTGLKMGDIIKIRRVLANQSDREVLTSSLSLYI